MTGCIEANKMSNPLKNKLLTILIITACILWLSFTTLHTKSEVIITPNPVIVKEEPTIAELTEKIAPAFNQSPKLIEKIIYCESGGVIQSHDGGRGLNITGIHDTTFNGWLKEYEKEYHDTLNKDSSYDQIKMMSWAFSKGYANQWTTYVAYMNGGSYTFYSKLLGKTFTAICK